MRRHRRLARSGPWMVMAIFMVMAMVVVMVMVMVMVTVTVTVNWRPAPAAPVSGGGRLIHTGYHTLTGDAD